MSIVSCVYNLPDGLFKKVAEKTEGVIIVQEPLENPKACEPKGHVGHNVNQYAHLKQMSGLEFVSVFV